MKDLFPGHFKESEDHIKTVWDSCIFVFDANILLNLYRYSDKNRKEFLNILEDNKDRVWLPNRVAEEYLNNRLTAIDKQESSYDTMISSISSLKKDLENSNQHPFVSSDMMTEVQNTFDMLCNELSANKEVHTKRINDDEIRDKLLEIFSQRVGLPYLNEKLEEIVIEGKLRYQAQIPPGYKDSKKSNSEDTLFERCRPYGDLIVWLQIIDKAKETGKPIILITNDKKEDWWKIFKGKTIGPRPELIKEFKDDVGNDFYMYQPDRFLELARENLNEQVSDNLVEEIREIRRRDKIAHNRNLNDDFHEKKERVKYIDYREIESLQDELIFSNNEAKYLNMTLEELHNVLKSLKTDSKYLMEEYRNNEPENQNYAFYEELMNKINENSIEIVNVQEKIQNISNSLREVEGRKNGLERVIAHKNAIYKNQEF